MHWYRDVCVYMCIEGERLDVIVNFIVLCQNIIFSPGTFKK